MGWRLVNRTNYRAVVFDVEGILGAGAWAAGPDDAESHHCPCRSLGGGQYQAADGGNYRRVNGALRSTLPACRVTADARRGHETRSPACDS